MIKLFSFLPPVPYPGQGPFIIHKNTVCSESHCALIQMRSSYERTTVSTNSIKQLHNLPALHLNRCLITEYSKTTAHFNGNFDTDNQIYVS
jgi:hypothetical protein